MPPQNQYNLKKIIIIGVLLLIIAGIIGFLLLRKKNISDDGTGSGRDIFPFGETIVPPPVPVGDGTTEVTGDGTVSNPFAIVVGERLRQITNYPVTGFFPSVITKIITEPKLDEATGETTVVSRTEPADMIRFNVKQTGILMDAEIASDTILVSQKTQTEIPAAEEIWFGNGGNTITYRSWNDTNRNIDTVVGKIPPEETLSYCTTPFITDLKTGMKNTEVKELQNYIKEKLDIAITVDGSYGPKTAGLVKQIQKLFSIPETGIVDAPTRETINTDCATIVAEFKQEHEGPAKLSASFLDPAIIRGAVSPDGTQLFFLKKTSTGVTGYVSSSDGAGQRSIFESPFTEWMPQFVNKTTVALTTLASREADGYLYFLDTQTGNFKKILGPVRGLTTLVSPDATMVIYSTSTDNGIATRIYNTVTGDLQNSDLVTLPAKCVWQDTAIAICGIPQSIPGNQYPDAWYQGTVTFDDVLWSLDTKTKSTSVVLSPNQRFDVTKLGISPDNNYLYFVNHLDDTLWSYRLR